MLLISITLRYNRSIESIPKSSTNFKFLIIFFFLYIISVSASNSLVFLTGQDFIALFQTAGGSPELFCFSRYLAYQHTATHLFSALMQTQTRGKKKKKTLQKLSICAQSFADLILWGMFKDRNDSFWLSSECLTAAV